MNRRTNLRCSAFSLAIILLMGTVAGCAKVRTETRRDMRGRPVTVTIRKGKDGKEIRTTTRGDKPLPIEGYKFGGTAVSKTSTTGGIDQQPRRVASPSRSIFGGGGKWYVNGKPVAAPSQALPEAPVQGPQPEPKPENNSQ